MIKRLFDFTVSSLGLLLALPILLPVIFLVWWHDKHSPFYIAPRVGKNEKMFDMIKLRSMTKDAGKTGVDSTAANDTRITPVGHFVRRYKLDELTQLWNVILGDMSLVGPRPNVKRETDLYSPEEKKLLSIKPGITDFASIVFSDEGEILKDKADPDLAYNQIIRPWKSRLGLVYVRHHDLLIDLKLIFWTIVAIVSREKALSGVVDILFELKVDSAVMRIALRQEVLIPTPPPGMTEIVSSR